MTTWTFGSTTFTTDKDSRLDRLLWELSREFPDLVFIHKRDSTWHWFLHILICIFTLGFNRKYLSKMTTTGKNSIAWSDAHWKRLNSGIDADHDRVWATLMHERVHLRQFKRLGSFKMAVHYLHPPFVIWHHGRIVTERPGYIQSLRAQWSLGNTEMILGAVKFKDGSTYRDRWVSQFTGSNYGWMHLLGRKTVEGWYDAEIRRLQIVNPPPPQV